MTGDGVNDAQDLAQTEVGIAVGFGTDVAAETTDIIPVNSDPGAVAKMIDLEKKNYRKNYPKPRMGSGLQRPDNSVSGRYSISLIFAESSDGRRADECRYHRSTTEHKFIKN
ncbi:Copper-exporting P-type ATPase B [Chryseobacterium salivictor]|uniref:Copper-exporting P-type ATPase B n=1 Tax=Chryseobacterium salivictor TaxID=2547600 RepID=A0A4V1AL70_9FLAO|nr:Copper-exporting P-type ATPase B [Chryseobacterium salivictor]